MERKPYKIPKAWRAWGGEFNTLTSIREWDVILWRVPDSSGDFLLMRPRSGVYSFIRLSDGLECPSTPEPPTEVLTFARSYRALVS